MKMVSPSPLGGVLEPLSAILGYLGAILRPSWGHLLPAWDHVGVLFGPSRCHLGVILVISASLPCPWGYPGAILGPSRGHSVPSQPSLGPCCCRFLLGEFGSQTQKVIVLPKVFDVFLYIPAFGHLSEFRSQTH